MGGGMEMLAATQGCQAGANAVHAPVMVEEMVNAIAVDRDGGYVDATFGRGGHARRLLGELSPNARLLALDRDAAAVASAECLAGEDPRVRACRGRFSALREYFDDEAWGAQSGVMFDVGVSSPQLDDPRRGFSFDADGPLDMRMDQRDALTAAAWLNRAAQSEIADVIRRYGEERHAGRLARRIVASRPLETTSDLAALVAGALNVSTARSVARRAGAARVYARVFQAVRIRVNDELAELDRGLNAAFAALEVGGRLAVITFHSLEHRLVRQRFRSWVEGPALPRRLPIKGAAARVASRIDVVGKGVRPSSTELEANPRARSAFLQAVEKVATDAPFSTDASAGRRTRSPG